MDKNRRLNEIVNLLRIHNFATITSLKERFNVSEMTVRRDLSQLAEDNIVRLVPGGAILPPAVDTGGDKYVVTQQETLQIREKLNIGHRAASLIEPNDTIILDIGSTTEYVAKFTREDVPLTVMCYTLNTLVEIYRKKNCQIIFPGGFFHYDELMFESPEGIELIKRTRADKAFISAAGLHRDLGVTTVYPYETAIKRAIMQSAKTRILLIDASKFGKIRSVYFANIDDFDMIITNAEIPQEYTEHIRNLGVQLIVT